jgi:hypothetical protein
MSTEHSRITGHVIIERHNEGGELLERFERHNLVTQVGDEMYSQRGASISGAPAAPTGMRLGSGANTGANAPAITGAGAALATYLSGSNHAFDSTYPQTSIDGDGGDDITYKCTYAPGQATTTSPITETVIVNDTIATNATSVAANTISRIAVTGISAKGSGDTLTVTWIHSLLGS